MIIENISNCIFKIYTSSWTWSWFYLKDKNIIVTNHHVIHWYKEVSLENINKERYFGKVVYINPKNDIAFIQPEKEFDNKQISLWDLQTLENSEQVFVLWFPFWMPFTITKWIISSPKQFIDWDYYIQTDAAINPWNSWWPLVTHDWKLLWIVNSKVHNADNVGFAIPFHKLVDDLENLKENIDLKFCIKCSWCNNLIFNKSEYCEYCWIYLDTKLFENWYLTNLWEFIESTINKLWINPVLTRNWNEYREFYYNKVIIRIFVYDMDYIFITSPINIPPTENIESFYKYILSDEHHPFKLGIDNNQVYISYRIYIDDILTSKASEISSNMLNMIISANELSQKLYQDYWCKYSNYSKV